MWNAPIIVKQHYKIISMKVNLDLHIDIIYTDGSI